MKRGRYYLGRVVKINLDQKKLMDAITKAPTVNIGKFDWTITDVEDHRGDELPYVFGRLFKYAKDGHAKVIDEENRSQIEVDVPNLVEASSPFVYLPECSGIVFLQVWNGIQEDVFPRRFKSIIEAAFDNFLIACDIEPVSDYRAFTTRLKKLDKFIEFSATVHPPNPLFGRLWGSLHEYIEMRNTSEVTVQEKASKSTGIKSNIIEHMDQILESSDYEPNEVPAIGDAALLMAADGYGRGRVTGVEGENEVTIKTSDTQKNFSYYKDPVPIDLANKARKLFDAVSKERDMSH